MGSALPIIYPQNLTLFEVEKPGHVPWGLNYFNRSLDAIDGSYCTYEERANSTTKGGRPQCGVFKPTNVISLLWADAETHSTRVWLERHRNKYLKLGLQGVSLFFASGDEGISAVNEENLDPNLCSNPSVPPVFLASWPSGCP